MAQTSFKVGSGEEVTWDSQCVRPSELGGQGGPLLLVQDPGWVEMGPRWAGRAEKEASTWKVPLMAGCPQ